MFRIGSKNLPLQNLSYHIPKNAHNNSAMLLNGLRTVARLMKNNTIIIYASCVKGYRGTVPQLCVRKELSNDAIPLICTFPLKLIDSTLDIRRHHYFHHCYRAAYYAYKLLAYVTPDRIDSVTQ